MIQIYHVVFMALVVCTACGAASDIPRKERLRRLSNTIHSRVDSREANQQNSRSVEQALDEDVLKNMMRFEVRRTLGPGQACGQHPKCQELGFRSDDLYYTVGEGDESIIGKRPMIIVGFDPKGNVIRVWNLRIH